MVHWPAAECEGGRGGGGRGTDKQPHNQTISFAKPSYKVTVRPREDDGHRCPQSSLCNNITVQTPLLGKKHTWRSVLCRATTITWPTRAFKVTLWLPLSRKSLLQQASASDRFSTLLNPAPCTGFLTKQPIPVRATNSRSLNVTLVTFQLFHAH